MNRKKESKIVLSCTVAQLVMEILKGLFQLLFILVIVGQGKRPFSYSSFVFFRFHQTLPTKVYQLVELMSLPQTVRVVFSTSIYVLQCSDEVRLFFGFFNFMFVHARFLL